MMMEESCIDESDRSSNRDDDVFPTWCWSKNRNSIGAGHQSCLTAFYQGRPVERKEVGFNDRLVWCSPLFFAPPDGEIW